VALSRDSGFVVRLVGTAEENDVFTVGIADAPEGTGRCLLFSIGTSADSRSPDVSAEFDTYCIVDEVQSTTYGGVIGCVLAPQELTLKFDDKAAQDLCLDRECRFPLHVDDLAIARLRDGLRRVFSGAGETLTELVL
jgi:hypothetical protein